MKTIRFFIGVKGLSGTAHHVIPDRIEAGTFMLAAAVTGSCLFLETADIYSLPAFAAFMQNSGVSIIQLQNGLLVHCVSPW